MRFPLVQGPMTRVSDTAEFALSVAEGGALPMVALALLKDAPLDALLARTATLLKDLHWGIGLLGFAPQSLLDEQVAIALKHKPDYAIIAGGRPDQAVRLDQAGIPSFLHVPGAKLIPMFLQEGARRFIFEGRECGGHIGPLSSFVLVERDGRRAARRTGAAASTTRRRSRCCSPAASTTRSRPRWCRCWPRRSPRAA